MAITTPFLYFEERLRMSSTMQLSDTGFDHSLYLRRRQQPACRALANEPER